MIQNNFPDIDKIFSISTTAEFESMALKVFNFQYKNNKVYGDYCRLLKIKPNKIKVVRDIPFLPISFFKSHTIICNDEKKYQQKFTSSGTSGLMTSSHFVKDLKIYEKSFIEGFQRFYGELDNYIVLGLLPSYLEREGSSLVYMVERLIKLSGSSKSGFFLNDFEGLLSVISNNRSNKKIVLIGVSYALLDLAEQFSPDLSSCIIMETGGMKGKRKEMQKKELHHILQKGLNVGEIHSEYGMTELLSQAYAIKKGEFLTPPWMSVLVREYNDPFSYTNKKTGGLNIIDLANIYSCSFIATQDLGKIHEKYFEVLGRFDNSDIRGCNLLVQ